MSDQRTTPEVTSPIEASAGSWRSRESAIIAAYEAALAVASDLDLGTLLQRLTDLAREVGRARYAALGVANEQGRIVEFITSGITAEERAALGPIPQGHGLIGELIEHGEPMLVPDIAADPRSAGFPPNHPPMRTLLGVPLLHGPRTLGNLYLTDRLDGRPFDEDDLEIIRVLAAHAASAIDRARLYGQMEDARANAIEQRDQLRVIVDQLPSAVLIQTFPDAQIELANEVAVQLLLGDTPLRGVLPRYEVDYWLFDVDGQPVPAADRPGRRALRGETVRNQQFLLERAGGGRVAVLAQAAPLRGAGGAVTRAVTVFQDITRMREAEQLKDDFLSLISHEFRTPLTAIRGGAHLLTAEGDRLEPAVRQELLADVAVESDRLDRMLANMLSLAAVMAGRMRPATEPVLLGPLVRSLAGEMERRNPAYAFPVDLPDDVPPVEGDAGLLDQVLRNLYENAVKYSTGHGNIRTTLAGRGDVVVLRIADEGVGIAAEHVPFVFERFRRPGADPSVRGMGLGLYLSRLLIEAQGGRIWAESAGVGQGSTFSIELAVAREWFAEGDGPVATE